MYGNATDSSKDCVDNSHIKNSERCYESFWLDKDYRCFFTVRSMESSDLWFCRGCVGCNHCFGSVNLRNMSYCIYNQQYSKEEYDKKIMEMNLHTRSGLAKVRDQAREFWDTQPVKYHQGLKNLNCTGSYVTNSHNVSDSFLIREGENMKYCQYLQVPKNKDCYDATAWGENMELNYETCLCGENSYNIKFSADCWPNLRDSEYCMTLFSCSDCFGCIGLKKKQYCILNKQYTKEEYFKMVEKIKKHMDEMPYVDKKGRIYKYGEFFPIELCPFGYNNTTAIQYFPMTKENAEENDYPWIEIPRGEYKITLKTGELPDSITDVTDKLLQEVIECENCKGPYRILENELSFYKKENLPIPAMCNDCRFNRRIQDRLKLELYERTCMCAGATDQTKKYTNTAKHVHGDQPCNEIFKTGYSSDMPEMVYCEKCYQQEVY